MTVLLTAPKLEISFAGKKDKVQILRVSEPKVK